MPHKINLVDKDGNQSEVTLPDYALDSTQQLLLKSMQALVKTNPKAQKAYEDLIGATKKVVTATEESASQQEKDAKALQNAVQTAGDKQISALKQFRTNFADRVGSDMRDTFTAGGNILTAAIKTATVGLAAGAGLLYKTFMDTSDAFRQLAQSGLGGAGGTGREAQDAVGNLTRLGMSANEAASMLTSFGRASAVLGKSNFSKFVSGVASAGTFAADLGLTLEEAAEYAAEELDIRQRAMAGNLQLGDAQAKSITAAIRETQRLASVMGVSMKDIVADKKQFLDNNANIQNLMAKTAAGRREALMAEINSTIGASSALGDQGKKLFQSLVNSAALQNPLMDSNLQNIADQGIAGQQLVALTMQMNRSMYENGKLPKSFLQQYQSLLANMDDQTLTQLGYLIGDSEFARTIQNASFDVKAAGNRLTKAINGVGDINDPMVTAGANFQNVMNQVTGAFTTVRNNLIGELAPGINEFFRAFMDSGVTEADEKIIKEKMAVWDKEHQLSANASDKEKELYDKKRQEEIKRLYDAKRGQTVLGTLNTALTDIARTIVKVFFGDLAGGGKELGDTLREKLIPWIKETAERIKNWLEEIKGDTFGEKIKNFAKKLFQDALPGITYVLTETIKSVFTSPTVITGLVAAFGLLFGASVVKSMVGAAISSAITRLITGSVAATTATTAATSAGTAGAGAAAAGAGAGLLAKAKSYGGAFGNTLKALPSAGLAGKAITGASVAGGALMVGKDAFDIGSSLYKGESVKGADIGGVAGGVLGGVAGAFLGGPVGAAIGASLGNMAGEWVGSFFDKGEAAQQGQDIAKQTAEQLKQQEGLAAMAMDPDHIKAVAAALKDFNAVSVANISKGLEVFNPVLQSLFNIINKVRTQFVEIVNQKLGTFLTIIKGLNEQGAILPNTTQFIHELSAKIESIKVEPIFKLSTAFNALANALKNFSELTTSTLIGRAFDWFTGKQDTTEDVIKVLNNFASKVDSEKLLKAAEATQAFNTAMQGLLGPTKESTEVIKPNDTTQTNNTTQSSTQTPQMDNQAEMVQLLGDIKKLFAEQRSLLQSIKTNTSTPEDQK
jgi:hypothetical protein